MDKRTFDLEERTLKFAKRVLELVKRLQRSPENVVLIRQAVRAATSIGANYREANEADSKKDFVHILQSH